MIKITTQRGAGEISLKLEGKLCGAAVCELQRHWQTTSEEARGVGATLRVELADVIFISAAGKQLLSEIHAQGATLCGNGLMTQALLAELQARPTPSPTPAPEQPII
jgi:hypothetical protein